MQIISGIQLEGNSRSNTDKDIFAATRIAALASACQTKKAAKGENDTGSIFSQDLPPTNLSLSPICSPLFAQNFTNKCPSNNWVKLMENKER